MKPRETLAVFLLASAAVWPGAVPAAADPVAQLIAQSRAALGGDALGKIKVLEIRSKIDSAGLHGTGTGYQEIGGPRLAETASLPPIVNGDGYDGKDVWNSDGSGLVWVDGGEAGRAQEIAQAYFGDYQLWVPGRGGATVVARGPQTANGITYDVLRVTVPGAASPVDAWFDRRTHLPMRYVQTIGPKTSTVDVSDYRPVRGLMVAYKTHVDDGQGNLTDATVTQALADPPGAGARLAKPPSTVHDFSIGGGATQTTVPFELVGVHVYLPVMINGHGPYRFVFDTGGLNLIDPAVAKEAGTAAKGSAQGGGVGSGTESIAFAPVDALKIGDATLRDQLFFVAPTRAGFGISAGEQIDGLIGFEVLARFVTTFDYQNKWIVLQMPSATNALPAGAQSIPFVLDGKQPQFPCTLDAIPSQCTVDTGARTSISLMTPFLATHPQVVPQTSTAVGVNGFGFGGPALGKLGRLASLGIGTLTLTNVVADFSTQQKGAFAAPFVAANVGGGVWKRFTLILDYGKQVMGLVPNAAYGEPDSYERAGLYLLNRGGKYVVLDTRPGTPAEAAGLTKDDTIDTVDGKPASSMSLQALRNLFMQPPGTVLHLGVTEKGGAQRAITLTLRDFV